MKIFLLSFLTMLATVSFAQNEEPGCHIEAPKQIPGGCGSLWMSGDDFQITATCKVSDFSLKVYNRWGELLFESKDITESWDASKAPAGAYYYVTKGSFETGEEFDQNGTFYLIK